MNDQDRNAERLGQVSPIPNHPTVGKGYPALGVVIGRFQPFHHDHLRYARAARVHCGHLVIGITNPDVLHTTADPTDPNRSTSAANPLTYYDRLVLVRETLLGDGWPAATFDIVPLPINKPELISGYVPDGATFFLTIYDAWGRKKADVLRSLGYSVAVLWDRPLEEKGLSAGTVRETIRSNRPWEHYLHPAAVIAASGLGLVDKIRATAPFKEPGET